MLDVELLNRPGPPRIDAKFTVAAGECLALTGPSGSGKTSILRMIAGLRTPTQGRVSIAGRVLLDTDAGIELSPEERGCGYVFQENALFPHLPVWRNVAFGLTGVARRVRRGAAVELLDRLGIAGLADASPNDISGGEQQRVALARALASRPQALLLDEPFGALDVRGRARAAHEIVELVREFGVPTLLVTHDFFEASLIGSRVAVLEQGSIAQLGEASDLAANPANSFVANLTGANVLHGEAQQRADGLTEVALAGGGVLLSTDVAAGPVAVAVHPWEITLRELPAASDSARNVLSGSISSITPVANRLRVALALPQPLVVEVTREAAFDLKLATGEPTAAVFKASATRLFAL